MPSYENKRFVDLTRGEWSALLLGAEVRSRRERWAVVLRWLRWEAWRATRLPGDIVKASDRDCVYLVHSGRPGHLRGWRIPCRLVDRLDGDLWAAVSHNPPETWLPNLTDVQF